MRQKCTRTKNKTYTGSHYAGQAFGRWEEDNGYDFLSFFYLLVFLSVPPSSLLAPALGPSAIRFHGFAHRGGENTQENVGAVSLNSFDLGANTIRDPRLLELLATQADFAPGV